MKLNHCCRESFLTAIYLMIPNIGGNREKQNITKLKIYILSESPWAKGVS